VGTTGRSSRVPYTLYKKRRKSCRPIRHQSILVPTIFPFLDTCGKIGCGLRNEKNIDGTLPKTTQPMKSSSALPLLLTALAGTSTAFTAQPVRHARSTGRSLRLCASQERQRDEHLDGPHQDINISDVLGRERYMRAVECSKTDGLCDATELEELNSGE